MESKNINSTLVNQMCANYNAQSGASLGADAKAMNEAARFCIDFTLETVRTRLRTGGWMIESEINHCITLVCNDLTQKPPTLEEQIGTIIERSYRNGLSSYDYKKIAAEIAAVVRAQK